jgi:hypothetical protein
MADALPAPDTGSTEGDRPGRYARSARSTPAASAPCSHSLSRPALTTRRAPYFREYFLSGRRAAIAELWRRALDRGDAELEATADDVIDILFGPLIFRRLTGHYPHRREHRPPRSAAAWPPRRRSATGSRPLAAD